MRRNLLSAVLSLSLLLSALVVAHAASYTFTTIDVPFSGAIGTIALGINNNGQIVGNYADQIRLHGFVYAAGVFTPLDVPFSDAIATIAFGINDRGQIVGYYIDFPASRAHGFVYAGPLAANAGKFTAATLAEN